MVTRIRQDNFRAALLGAHACKERSAVQRNSQDYALMLLEPICVWLVCVVSVCGRLHLSHCNLMNYEVWRRDRDSNPGSAQTDNGFRDRRIRPLCHLSVLVVQRDLTGHDCGRKDILCQKLLPSRNFCILPEIFENSDQSQQSCFTLWGA